MTTVLQVIDEANELLLGGSREQVVTLNTTVNTSVTSIVLTDGFEGVAKGDTLQIDSELMSVNTWNDGTNTATVTRAFRGSTAAAHTAAVQVVLNPIVANVVWMRHLNNELRSLSSPVAGLFKVDTADITYSASKYGFDMAGADDFDAVIDVYAEQPGSRGDFVPIGRRDWSVQREMDTTDFSTGYALRLTGNQGYPGRNVRVLVKTPFSLVNSFTDIVESASGLPSTAVDLLAVGMVIRAVESNEINRNKLETQPIRKLADVPAGALNSSAAGLRARYQQRRSEERARLMRRYGI